MAEVQSIENKEIRGISAKTVITIIVCTGSLLLSIMGTYYSLKEQITDVKMSKDSETKLNELKMKTLEQKVDIQGIQMNDFIRRYESQIQNQNTK